MIMEIYGIMELLRGQIKMMVDEGENIQPTIDIWKLIAHWTAQVVKEGILGNKEERNKQN